MIASDQSPQYSAGHILFVYTVVPVRRVRPSGSGSKRNCPRRLTRKLSRWGGWMSNGLHSFIGGGCCVTRNAKQRVGSHVSIGSTNAPVEKTHNRTASTPVPRISAPFG